MTYFQENEVTWSTATWHTAKQAPTPYLTKNKSGDLQRGPERWLRAALNAVANPNSPGAGLYRARVANAAALAEIARQEEDDSAYEHYTYEGVWVNGERTAVKFIRRYTTCSTYCTIMQAQLERNTQDIERLKPYFDGALQATGWGGYRARRYNLKTMPRPTVRCQCCGKTIRRPR